MSDQKDTIRKLIKEAKRTAKLSRLVVVVAFLYLMLQYQLPNSIFDFSSGSSEHVSLIDEEYAPPFELDSNEVKNGIHIPTGLIVDKGIEDVISTCQACHSLSIVMQNRADRDGWKDLIVWMQKTQNLWQLPNEGIILDYLSKNYAPNNTGRRKNLEDIDWYPYK